MSDMIFQDHDVQSVPVHITGTDEVNVDVADFGTWQTYPITASMGYIQLLAQDHRRHRAILIIQAGSAVATDTLLIGSMAQVQNNAGGKFAGGFSSFMGFVLENAQALYASTSATNTFYITVCDERFSEARK